MCGKQNDEPESNRNASNEMLKAGIIWRDSAENNISNVDGPAIDANKLENINNL